MQTLIKSLYDFISVGARAAEDSLSLIDLYNLPAPSTSGSTVILESHKFHLEPVTCREVRRIMMAFQLNKAPGYMIKYECLQ